jgi:DNA-binding NtrC family response regulator
MTPAILVVDDEPTMQETLRWSLEADGYRVSTAGSGEDAVARMETEEFDAVITDIILPGMTGLEVLDKARSLTPPRPVILITAYATVDTAVEALRRGAFDYVQKPLSLKDLQFRVRRALARPLSPTRIAESCPNDLIGDSPVMTAVRRRIADAAATASNVLITGESGTGKELVARAIHNASSRRASPLVAVNCAAIPEHLFESQLFGHTRGAFTGAVRTNPGLLLMANRGTLFLDEIGELSPSLQVKLLRVIEDRAVLALGAIRPVSTDVRIIASTNRDLPREVTAGRFREDLFYRLKVIHITLPPLREHPEDIPVIVEHLIRRLSVRLAMDVVGITDDALGMLTRHCWKGNVRELEHVIESAMVAGKAGMITPDHLPSDLGPSPAEAGAPLNLKQAVRGFERQLVLDVLAISNHDKREAARRLGLSLTSLYRKLAAASSRTISELGPPAR